MTESPCEGCGQGASVHECETFDIFYCENCGMESRVDRPRRRGWGERLPALSSRTESRRVTPTKGKKTNRG